MESLIHDRTIAPGVTERFSKHAQYERDEIDGHYRATKVTWQSESTGDVRIVERVRPFGRDQKPFLTLEEELRIFRRRKQRGHSHFCFSY